MFLKNVIQIFYFFRTKNFWDSAPRIWIFCLSLSIKDSRDLCRKGLMKIAKSLLQHINWFVSTDIFIWNIGVTSMKDWEIQILCTMSQYFQVLKIAWQHVVQHFIVYVSLNSRIRSETCLLTSKTSRSRRATALSATWTLGTFL